MAADWLAIATEYRVGLKPIRRIAVEHGVNEATIRHRAKINGWVRDGASIKREIVKANVAGRPVVAQGQPSRQDIAQSIDQAAVDDIRDMSLGLDNARLSLQIINRALILLGKDETYVTAAADDARNLKILAEVNKYNIEIIRRIRCLDDPITQPGAAQLSVDDEAILEHYRQHG
jgi:hypothetical protein